MEPTIDEWMIETAMELEVPEGHRVQVLEGRITVTPHDDGDHAVALSRLTVALSDAGAREKGLRVLPGLGMYLRSEHSGPMGLVIPDLSVVAEDLMDQPEPFNCYSPSAFRLVAEVTASNWRDDTEGKVRAYAKVGVPAYVIADREHGEVLVLTRPHDGVYQSRARYLPGRTVEIPGPVPCEIPADDLLQLRRSAERGGVGGTEEVAAEGGQRDEDGDG